MAERPDFWGITAPWAPTVIYIAFGLAALFVISRFAIDAAQWWRVGSPLARWDKPLVRIWRVIQYYFVQSKVLSKPYAGIMHVAIFWSMGIFFLGTALATIHHHFFPFLIDEVYFIYKLVLDLAVIVFLVGAGMAAYRRFIQKPARLTLDGRFAFSLVMLTVVVILGAVIESFRLAISRPEWAGWSPVGWTLAQIWPGIGMSVAGMQTAHQVTYVLHMAGVMVLIVTLPTSTLLHILTSAFNIFFSNLDQPLAKLRPIATTKEGEYIYADRLKNLTWKQLLNGETCTECGRCQDACPAYAAGQNLNPKELILNLKAAFRTERKLILSGKDEAKPLVGEWIKDETLWACMTCGACVKECPVLIEHVDSIVDMRRYLVSEGRVDEKLQEVLVNFGRYGNSFGQSERARAKWTQNLPTKIKDARREEVDYLWFVGDYASFNPMVNATIARFVEVMEKAGVDFGILYDGERNSGNDVRRIGEEGLFEVLVEKNSMALSKSKFKRIVTTDPHTYNTLKHEYPQDVLEGRPVLHYSELLDELISNGKLSLSKKLSYKVTYHDPCYLGRYNGIYDAPRRVIRATGCELIEMPRHKEHSFCCNAGGGKIWMKESEMKERPSENRMREAVALDGVQLYVVACPKDLTMYADAVKTTALEEKIAVKDLIELVYEAL